MDMIIPLAAAVGSTIILLIAVFGIRAMQERRR